MENPVQMLRSFFVFLIVFSGFAKGVVAQSGSEVVWVQIEARPTLEVARDRAATYAQSLPDVSGFALQGGWYAVALGPYTRADAEAVIESYRNQGLIPPDSYIAFSRSFGAQGW